MERVCEETVLDTFRGLEIQPACNRPNVTHFEGQEIQSLCLGMSARAAKLTARTEELGSVYTLLARWLLQDPRWCDFAFTSITINKNHAAAAHRDVGNTGPSVARTLGTFVGGELFHFPQDDGLSDPAELPMHEAEILDTSDFVLFDGTQAHGVFPYAGERYSVIYFTTQTATCPEAVSLVRDLKWRQD